MPVFLYNVPMTGNIYEHLNEAQKEAVFTTEGPVAVIAGAGSGKTRALTYRYAYLVNEIGIAPENILCVTFTNKAAAEMRQRIHALIHDQDTALINTFHGFCVTVLSEESYLISYPQKFLVLDNSDIDDMLRIIYDQRHLTLRDSTFAQARDMFEMRKCLREPDYFRMLISMDDGELYRKYMSAEQTEDILFYGYLYQQKKCFGLDYNDLIILTLHVFREHPEICLKWQKRLEYIMIDEFQDIDPLQYELMERLCGYYQNLFVVGDPDQTIYTWRGARIGYILEFAKTHPGTKTILMMQNYRSSPQILDAANKLISRNRNRVEKILLAQCEDGCPVRYHHAITDEKEAQFLADEIMKLHDAGAEFRDIAVLYRAHYVTRSAEMVFLKRQIPYRIYSGVPFFARMEIKDALSYLRILALRDDLSFRRIINRPRRNIGKRRMALLEAYAQEHGCTLFRALEVLSDSRDFAGTSAREFLAMISRLSERSSGRQISDVFRDIMQESGYEEMLRTEGSQERLDNLSELKQSILEYELTCGEEADLISYLDHAALYSVQDMPQGGDQVRMMTVHAAKGLEFPHVFLCGLSDGIFPSRRTKSEEAMEEERRLFFVAMTRAERSLVLSDAEGRNFDRTYRYPSRFIFDVSEAHMQFDQPLPEKLVSGAREHFAAGEEKMRAEERSRMFHVQERVHHVVFGDGIITEIDFLNGKISILFDSMQRERVFSLKAADKLTHIEEEVQ